MNKAQFIAYLAPQFGDSKKEAARAVEVVFDAIVRNISKGEDVSSNSTSKGCSCKGCKESFKGKEGCTQSCKESKASSLSQYSIKKRDLIHEVPFFTLIYSQLSN